LGGVCVNLLKRLLIMWQIHLVWVINSFSIKTRRSRCVWFSIHIITICWLGIVVELGMN